MHGASIYFRSARLETAVGARQRSGPDRNFTVRRETSTRPCANRVTLEKEKEEKKRRTRFPVTGGISCLTDRRDSETNDARLLRHNESHLGTAQRDGKLPKYPEVRNSTR